MAIAFWRYDKDRKDKICYNEIYYERARGYDKNGGTSLLPMEEILFLADDNTTLFCFTGRKNDKPKD